METIETCPGNYLKVLKYMDCSSSKSLSSFGSFNIAERFQKFGHFDSYWGCLGIFLNFNEK